MPDSFAADAFGVAHLFNGIDKPQRFSPKVGSFETAGIVAPTQAISMGGAGAGNIVGEFYAFARFVDRDGYYSSLTPVSEKFEPSVTVATISNATNASPVVITSSAHGLGTGQVVRIKGVMGNDINGIWYANVLSSTTFELWYDSEFAQPSVGAGTYNSGGFVQTGVSQVIYSNLPVSAESRVTRRQVLRNKDGDTTVFYVDIDTDDLTSTSLTSLADSASLLTAVSLFDTAGRSLVDKTPPPDHKKLVCHHLGRMFAAGNEPYSEGAVAVTNGSTTVTGLSTEWGVATFANRFFEVIGGTKQYEISYVASTTSLELTEPYEGSTDPYAYYVIHAGDGERRTIYWSEPAQPEAWPVTNSLTLEEDPGAGEITGLMPLRRWVYFNCDARIYSFSHVANPLDDGFSVKAAKRGCVNNRCWVVIEDMAYMMDTLGFHVFAGNDDSDISTPSVQNLFRRSNAPYRINWEARRYFHSIYDPGEATIRWFVCLGGHYTPYHAVCYQIRLKRWWIEEYPFPIGASCLGRLDGRPCVFLGSDGKRIFAFGESTLDGPDPTGGTVRGTVTTAGLNWIADSSASFPTTGVAGGPVVIVQGRGKGQVNRITSVSGTRLNCRDSWTIQPDTTSKYQVGGIPWRWRSGWLRWIDDEENTKRGVSVEFTPLSTQAHMHVNLYSDLAASPQVWKVQKQALSDSNGIAPLMDDANTDLAVDCTRANGFVTTSVDSLKPQGTHGPRYLAVALEGTQNDEQMAILRLTVEGAR